MKPSKKATYIVFVTTILFLGGAISFIFNPLGLGPEPDIVLSRDFFNTPAEDLSELELLVDGESAFGNIIAAIDAARKSIYIQTYIWKDDQIGRRMVTKLKAAADRGVAVTIRKDVLGTVFELGDMLKGKPSPVFTSAGLKGYKNINVEQRRICRHGSQQILHCGPAGGHIRRYEYCRRIPQTVARLHGCDPE